MSTTVEAPAVPRLKERYLKEIVPELEKEFNYSNPMQVAGLEKIVVSMGVWGCSPRFQTHRRRDP